MEDRIICDQKDTTRFLATSWFIRMHFHLFQVTTTLNETRMEEYSGGSLYGIYYHFWAFLFFSSNTSLRDGGASNVSMIMSTHWKRISISRLSPLPRVYIVEQCSMMKPQRVRRESVSPGDN
jgi:hypothetical protein